MDGNTSLVTNCLKTHADSNLEQSIRLIDIDSVFLVIC